MMERARPTRFFIPPLKVSGILSSWPSISMTSSISATFVGKTFGRVRPPRAAERRCFPPPSSNQKVHRFGKECRSSCGSAPSWRSFIPMMFCPWIQISPASGVINPTRCLSKTLLPPPLRPIIASVSPVATSRSTPRKISCSPNFLRQRAHRDHRRRIIADQMSFSGRLLRWRRFDHRNAQLSTLNSQLSTA